jgi:hypothetical protein
MPALQILHILNFKNFSVSYFSKQAYHRAPGFVVHDLKGKKKWYEELRVYYSNSTGVINYFSCSDE